MNQVNIVGRITRDIEIRMTNNNKTVTQFSVAVPRNKDVTYFINCVAWEGCADLLAKWVHKGDQVGITGMLTSRTYDNQNGQKVFVTEVLVNDVTLLANPRKDDDSATPSDNKIEIKDEDLPF